MRLTRFIALLCLFTVSLLVERYGVAFPFTWILIIFVSLRNTPRLLVLVLLCLCTDLFIALPLGSSSLVLAGVLGAIRLRLGNRAAQLLYLTGIGVLLGLVYMVLRHTVHPLHLFFTGLACFLLYTVTLKSPKLQEIGDVET